MTDWLEGRTGHRVGFLGGHRSGDLFFKGLGQAAFQELPAGPKLTVVLGIFRAFTTAVVKDGNHCRWPLSRLLLTRRGRFGACREENRLLIHEVVKNNTGIRGGE